MQTNHHLSQETNGVLKILLILDMKQEQEILLYFSLSYLAILFLPLFAFFLPPLFLSLRLFPHFITFTSPFSSLPSSLNFFHFPSVPFFPPFHSPPFLSFLPFFLLLLISFSLSSQFLSFTSPFYPFLSLTSSPIPSFPLSPVFPLPSFHLLSSPLILFPLPFSSSPFHFLPSLSSPVVFKVSVSQICFYLDFNLDDSYTPKKVTVRSGTSSHDLIDVTAIELNEPVGTTSLFLSLFLYSSLFPSVLLLLLLLLFVACVFSSTLLPRQPSSFLFFSILYLLFLSIYLFLCVCVCVSLSRSLCVFLP